MHVMVSGSDQTGRAENSAMSGLMSRQDPSSPTALGISPEWKSSKTKGQRGNDVFGLAGTVDIGSPKIEIGP
jgi:hypothetical protein